MNTINNFIFDLDGTIINSSKEVLRCFELAFKKASFKIDKTRLNSNLIGPPLKQILLNLAPNIDEKSLDIVMQNFRQIYDYDNNDISTFYDGMNFLLQELKNQKKKIFMATFKPTEPTMRIIEQFKLNMFDDIYTIDKFEKSLSKEEMLIDIISKYNLNKNETVMIGDAASDMIAAKKAEIKGIGVLWGYGKDKKPIKDSADFIVKNIEELRKCLKLNYQTI